jgi:hypothetical protein
MEIGPFSQNKQYMHNVTLGNNHPIVCVPTTYIYALSNFILFVISKHNNILSCWLILDYYW